MWLLTACALLLFVGEILTRSLLAIKISRVVASSLFSLLNPMGLVYSFQAPLKANIYSHFVANFLSWVLHHIPRVIRVCYTAAGFVLAQLAHQKLGIWKATHREDDFNIQSFFVQLSSICRYCMSWLFCGKLNIASNLPRKKGRAPGTGREGGKCLQYCLSRYSLFYINCQEDSNAFIGLS